MPQIALNAATGRAGEAAAGISALGKKMIPSLTGTATRRFPDALDRVAKVLTEVKNVANLRLTKQLQDFIAYAAQEGYKLKLIIRFDTRLTPALQDALDAARIKGLEIEILRTLP